MEEVAVIRRVANRTAISIKFWPASVLYFDLRTIVQANVVERELSLSVSERSTHNKGASWLRGKPRLSLYSVSQVEHWAAAAAGASFFVSYVNEIACGHFGQVRQDHVTACVMPTLQSANVAWPGHHIGWGCFYGLSP
jgi:hypothetical protein